MGTGKLFPPLRLITTLTFSHHFLRSLENKRRATRLPLLRQYPHQNSSRLVLRSSPCCVPGHLASQQSSDFELGSGLKPNSRAAETTAAPARSRLASRILAERLASSSTISANTLPSTSPAPPNSTGPPKFMSVKSTLGSSAATDSATVPCVSCSAFIEGFSSQ